MLLAQIKQFIIWIFFKIHFANDTLYLFNYSKPNTPNDFSLLLDLLINKTINSNHYEYKEVPVISKKSYH